MRGKIVEKGSEDKRIAYGAGCTWWDSIQKVGKNGGLPCCPHCSGMLLEVKNESKWFADAKKYEEGGNPDYVNFLKWQRGKCFKSVDRAKTQYQFESKDAQLKAKESELSTSKQQTQPKISALINKTLSDLDRGCGPHIRDFIEELQKLQAGA